MVSAPTISAGLSLPAVGQTSLPLFSGEGVRRSSGDGRFFIPDLNASNEESGFCIQGRARPSFHDTQRPVLFGGDNRFVPIETSTAELFSSRFPQAGTPGAVATAFSRRAEERRRAALIFRRRSRGEDRETEQMWEMQDLPRLSVHLIRRIWQLLQLFEQDRFNRSITHGLVDELRADLRALVGGLPGAEMINALFPPWRQSGLTAMSGRLDEIMDHFDEVRAHAGDIEKILFLLNDMIDINFAGNDMGRLRQSFALLGRRLHEALKAGFYGLIELDRVWCAAMET